MTYATEEERIAARRASRRKGYYGEDRPKTHFYPETRAPRVDRSKMTEEEWDAHKKKMASEKSARYNARNPGLTNGKLRTRRAENPWYAPLLAAGDRARKQGLGFNLTKEWAVTTYTGSCELTGLPFVISYQEKARKSGGRPYSPSIDKIDPFRGYTEDNSRWVLFSINSFKQQMSDAEMFTIAEALLNKRNVQSPPCPQSPTQPPLPE